MLSLWVAVTACVGVLQLAVLSWATRSVRVGTLLLAVIAGLYGAGMLALLLEWASTTVLTPLVADPVQVASWTIDPFIEEAAKIAPLCVAAACWPALRTQWGVTDWLLAGAAVGAGFGLLEKLATIQTTAATAMPGVGGWWMPGMWVPDPWRVITVWLPDPATIGTLTLGQTGVYRHLAWGALAGLAVGLAVRLRGTARLWGLVPYVLAGGMHAAYNHAIVGQPGGNLLADALLAPFTATGSAPGLWPLLALAAATWLDLPALRGQKAAHQELWLPGEQAGDTTSSVAALARYARLRPPWTIWVMCGWVTLRRYTLYGLAHAPHRAEPLRQEAAQIAARLRRAAAERAWAVVSLRTALNHPKAADWRPRWWRYWPWPVAAVLSLPAWLYWGLGTTPGITAPRETVIAGNWFPALAGVLLAAALWLGWCLYTLVRLLPGTTTDPEYSGPLQIMQFRLTTAAGALLLALVCLLDILAGATGSDPLTAVLGGTAPPAVHVLEALNNLELAAGIALLAAAFLLFPPAGLVALAGGGVIVVPTITSGFVTLSALGLTGIALSQTGPGSSNDPSSSTSQGGPAASGGGTGGASGGGPAVSRVPDLHGKTLTEAERDLAGGGFRFVSETKGGYRQWVHSDGSRIWIRPNGEVQRLGPKINPGPNTRNYSPRYDQGGRPTQNHNTGEIVQR